MIETREALTAVLHTAVSETARHNAHPGWLDVAACSRMMLHLLGGSITGPGHRSIAGTGEELLLNVATQLLRCTEPDAHTLAGQKAVAFNALGTVIGEALQAIQRGQR